MKKIISAFLSISLAVSLSGCSITGVARILEESQNSQSTQSRNRDSAVTQKPQDRQKSKQEQVPEEIRTINITPEQEYWLNGTHAVLTLVNGCEVDIFGCAGHPPGSFTPKELQRGGRDSLRRWWNVTSREELDQTIRRLVKGMHNPAFLEEAEYYGITQVTEDELEYELMGLDDGSAFYFRTMFAAYDKFGKKAIMAWDLSRAVQLCESGYTAGYYTYDEAIEKSLEIGKVIQKDFDSWDDFFESYMYGFAYWSENETQYNERMDILSQLKADPNSPLQLDWNLSLSID